MTQPNEEKTMEDNIGGVITRNTRSVLIEPSGRAYHDVSFEDLVEDLKYLIHSEKQKSYKQGLEDAVGFIKENALHSPWLRTKSEIPYIVTEKLLEEAKNLSAKK